MQGFYFSRQRIGYTQTFVAAFLLPMQIIQAQHQNRLLSFAAAFPLICPIPAHTIQQLHKPPIYRPRHAGGHTVKRNTSTDTRYHRHAGRCTGQRSRPIIIMYIGVLWCVPVMGSCQTEHHSADHTSGCGSVHLACILCMVSAWQLEIWHRVGLAHSTRRDSPAAGARLAAAELLAACRRFSFRAFAR